ncbi:diacylglycerol/lipid kinase family protein [Afifella pfennigii]|uniref:diacylglycerol/lipid kinase family protein n=1 Tax=Afifella pfennigii TaxID=209897 RepID=UPI00068C4B11|nr:diacylglycerol kinase family protein [Afifella pfennigii]
MAQPHPAPEACEDAEGRAARPLKLALVLNCDSGTLKGCDRSTGYRIASIFQAAGHDVRLSWESGAQAIRAVSAAFAQDGIEAVVVGGGDGSVSFAAGEAFRQQKMLGILPLGTMNLFARSLGMPLDMMQAAEALAHGCPEKVDIAEVNGRPFVHHVTLGLHPKMIRLREQLNYGSRLGKILASARALRLALRRPPLIRARIAAQGEERQVTTAVILVSNNPLGDGHLPYADDPRAAQLGLYVATSRRWTDLLELAAAFGLGRLRGSAIVEERHFEALTITLRQAQARASVDGEVVRLTSPLAIRQHPAGLPVLWPAGIAAERAPETAPLAKTA